MQALVSPKKVGVVAHEFVVEGIGAFYILEYAVERS